LARAASATGSNKALAAVAVAFAIAAGAWPEALGTPSEEVLPHLFAHPRVVDASDDSGPIYLHEPWGRPGEPETRGLVVTPVWPTLSWVAPPLSWPLLTERWQAAYLSYPARALRPLLGGGVAGLRRVGALLGALGLLLVAGIGRRLGAPRDALVGALLLGSWVGWLFLHRFAYLIESGPPLFAALALWLVLDGKPSRAVLAALAAGMAIALKATAAWELFGFALYLTWAKRWPRIGWRARIGAAVAFVAPLAPFIWAWAIGGAPAVVARKLALVASPSEIAARAPRIASAVAGFLGDPMALVGPLFAGARDAKVPVAGALAIAAVTVAAAVKLRARRDDREPERLLLAVAGCVFPLAIIFYDDRFPLQVAFLLAPWYALVVARLLVDVHRFLARPIGRRAALAAAAALGIAAQAPSLYRFVRAHATVGNPMLSAPAQRELTAALLARGEREPLTTTYNAVGVLETLSDGKLSPIHLYPLLAPRPGDDRDAYRRRAEAGFARALDQLRGPFVLPLADNLFEGLDEDPTLVREAFAAACAKAGRAPREIGRFPSTGRPLVALYEVAR